MELDKAQYTSDDVKNMAVNSAQLREQLRAKDPSAFDQVANGCSDLEKVLPEDGRNLKNSALKEKENYLRTKDPNCFVRLINDLEEMYGKAFKLMVENIQARKKAEAENAGRKEAGFVKISENTTYQNSKKVADRAVAAQEKQAQEEPAKVSRGSTRGSTVQKVSISDLKKEQDGLSGNSSTPDNEREKMEAYEKRLAARNGEKGSSSYESSQEQARSMEPPSRRKD